MKYRIFEWEDTTSDKKGTIKIKDKITEEEPYTTPEMAETIAGIVCNAIGIDKNKIKIKEIIN